MSLQAVLIPVFVQVALTFALLFAMGRLRIQALQRGEVKIRDIALREKVWPPRVTQLENAFHNQLELPPLFYVAVLLAIATRTADTAFVALAWFFVAARLVHALIHTSTNDVRHRLAAFLVGAAILLIMWIVLAARVLFPAG